MDRISPVSPASPLTFPTARRVQADSVGQYASVGQVSTQRLAVIYKPKGSSTVHFVPVDSPEKAAEFIREHDIDNDREPEVILFEEAYLRTTITVIKGRDNK